LLFNIRNGSITADSSGKIYFAEREWQNCFVHGADLETGESYVAKFRVDVPSAARFIPDPRPGNADARVVTITPGSSIPAKLVELYVRRGRAGQFEVHTIPGANAVVRCLETRLAAAVMAEGYASRSERSPELRLSKFPFQPKDNPTRLPRPGDHAL